LFLITRIDPKQVHPVDDEEWASFGLTWPASSAKDAHSFFLAGNELRGGAARSQGRLLGSGSREPSDQGYAACIDADGLLVLIQRSQASKGDSRALSLVLERAGCVDTIYLDEPVEVAATATQIEEMANEAERNAEPSVVQVSAGESPRPVVTWLRRQPMLGARRIFQDTPILPPSKWGYVQKRRVPYSGRATQN